MARILHGSRFVSCQRGFESECGATIRRATNYGCRQLAQAVTQCRCHHGTRRISCAEVGLDRMESDNNSCQFWWRTKCPQTRIKTLSDCNTVRVKEKFVLCNATCTLRNECNKFCKSLKVNTGMLWQEWWDLKYKRCGHFLAQSMDTFF